MFIIIITSQTKTIITSQCGGGAGGGGQRRRDGNPSGGGFLHWGKPHDAYLHKRGVGGCHGDRVRRASLRWRETRKEEIER